MICTMRARIEPDNARRLRRSGIIEQQELDLARLPRKDAEIDARGKGSSAERETPASIAAGRVFEVRKNSGPHFAPAERRATAVNRRM